MTRILFAVYCALMLTPVAARAQQDDAAAAAWVAGDHARARALYAARVDADSADLQALHRLGLLSAWNRDLDRAITLLRRRVALAPAPDARADLARTLSWAGRFNEAEIEYLQLLAEQPGDAEALRGLARVATWRGDLGRGERLWHNLLEAAPADVDAHLGMSQVLRWTGRPRRALEHARTAAALRRDSDTIEQLAWAEAAFAPGLTPGFVAENDSDDNRLLTASLTARVHATPRVALLASGYVRRAQGPVPAPAATSSRETQTLAIGPRIEVADGWMVTATGGAMRRDTGGMDAMWRASVASPSWRALSGSLAWGRTPMDFTADLMGRDIVMDDVTGSIAARPHPAVRVEAGAAATSFRGIRTHNRALARLGLDAALASWLHVRPRATAFRFDEAATEGYFAPDRYSLAEIGFGMDRWRAGWSFSAEIAPGVQRIGSSGSTQGALSGRARVGYTLAPGRDVGIGITFSNLGIERLQPGNAGYRYHAVNAVAAWSF
jgi:tetratricopeptide (TPR) repeat protein